MSRAARLPLASSRARRASSPERGASAVLLAVGIAVALVALGIGGFFAFRSSPGSPSATSTATGTAGTGTSAAVNADAVSIAGSAPYLTAGRGARVPFVEQQAELAATNGAVLAKDFSRDTLAGEGVGRRAVTLAGKGQYVEFTLTAPANSINVRYSIPDSTDGGDYNATLSVYANGAKLKSLDLTNRYSWFYGNFPFINAPGSNPHHLYDETHALLGQDLPAGAKVRLQIDAADLAKTYTIDLADFEQVAPAAAQPAGSVSVVDLGADPSGAKDSAKAFNDAIAQGVAKGQVVWIPAGTFQINEHISVNNVTVVGAGPWYSVVTGDGVGFYGKTAPKGSTNVHLSDFSILGTINIRDDSAQVNGIGGAIGGGSTITNLWIEHTKVGLWLDGPFKGLSITGNRIDNVTADGINLHNGIEDTTITGNFIRNTGDDAIATWAEKNADRNNVISFNTIEVPLLANGIAIYGGESNSATDNVISDIQNEGGGIHVGNRFTATPLAGTTKLERNTVLRSSAVDGGSGIGIGAIWFWALDEDMGAAISVKDTSLIDSAYVGVLFKGSGITNVSLENVTIDGAGTYALVGDATGSATVKNVVAKALGVGGSNAGCAGNKFTFTDGGGNTGWEKQGCDPGQSNAPTYTEAPAAGAADFSVVVDSAAGDVVAGQSSTTTVWTSVAAGAPGAVELSAAGAPAGVTVTFSPATVTAGGHSLMTVATTATAAPGHYDLTVTGKGAQSHTASYKLGVGTTSTWAVTATPATLTFAGTASGAASAGQTIEVKNTGSDTVSGVSVGALGDFSATSDCPATLAAGAGCTVTVTFLPSAAGDRTGSVTVSSSAPPVQIAVTGTATANASGNLAADKKATSTGDNAGFPASNATDGNSSSYWESTNKAFPQSITIDLGAATAFTKVVISVPPAKDWGARDETVAVLVSNDGTTFTVAKKAAPYRLDPEKGGNKATIVLSPTTARFIKLTVSANTGWAAAQLAEVEVLK
ncbi:MAG: hypothetical protein QOG52_1370 [Frankiaceae bacterium]|nr:hypothetical protein [Frankiaceae bacterium]